MRTKYLKSTDQVSWCLPRSDFRVTLINATVNPNPNPILRPLPIRSGKIKLPIRLEKGLQARATWLGLDDGKRWVDCHVHQCPRPVGKNACFLPDLGTSCERVDDDDAISTGIYSTICHPTTMYTCRIVEAYLYQRLVYLQCRRRFSDLVACCMSMYNICKMQQ